LKTETIYHVNSFCSTEESAESAARLGKTKKIVVMLTQTFLWASVMAGVFYCVKPFLLNLLYFSMSGNSSYSYVYILPLETPYVFDTTKLHTYLMSFAVNCFGFFSCVTFSVREIGSFENSK
jgi:hypothetical protein